MKIHKANEYLRQYPWLRYILRTDKLQIETEIERAWKYIRFAPFSSKCFRLNAFDLRIDVPRKQTRRRTPNDCVAVRAGIIVVTEFPGCLSYNPFAGKQKTLMAVLKGQVVEHGPESRFIAVVHVLEYYSDKGGVLLREVDVYMFEEASPYNDNNSTWRSKLLKKTTP